MIDTFGALIRKLFQVLGQHGMQCHLAAKTYDLRSAYRQVPIKQSHLKYAYFSVYNVEAEGLEPDLTLTRNYARGTTRKTKRAQVNAQAKLVTT